MSTFIGDNGEKEEDDDISDHIRYYIPNQNNVPNPADLFLCERADIE